MVDMLVVPTQKEFGEFINISQQAISDFDRRGVMGSGMTYRDRLDKYLDHIREQAAGRATLGDLDLATERAGLAREQRLRLQMQNAVTRREYGPIIEMELGLADVLTMIGSKLDTIVGKLKKQSDILTADDLVIVAEVVAVVRNDIADTAIEWFDDDNGDDDETE